ncbi:hypothetical protein [Spirosoma montaniterrae]|uniref:hypothetical protein n=1 Tax=Spirosoma montaniterrae TaxID=1178516 RepID=UPI0012FC355A|nr:hypothetical protein [Spirosoma montaniterrae]
MRKSEKFSVLPNKPIDAVTLNKILKGNKKPNEDDLLRIAQVVLDKPDATVHELWRFVQNYDIPVTEEGTLNLISGFTGWSALLISALDLTNETGRSRWPAGVRFAFSGKENGEPNYLTYDDDDSLETLKQSLVRFDTIYIAEDLQKLYLSHAVDGFCMLRSSFQKMPFDDFAEPPIQVSRLVSGYGTHLYVIGKGVTSYVSSADKPGLFGIIDQIEQLNTFIRSGRPVRLYYLKNATIERHLEQYLAYPDVVNVADKIQQTSQLPLTGDKYTSFLRTAREVIQKDDGLLILVAFEPILNRIYHDLLDDDSFTEQERSVINYRYVNLAQLVNEKSTYCLYCRPDSLRDPAKLMKINELLALVNTQPRLDRLNSIRLTDLLFPKEEAAGHPDIPRFERWKRVVETLQLRNNSLPILNLLTRQII